MPELPDVEMLKRSFDATSLHRPIAEVDVRSDAIVERGSAGELAGGLRGRSFEATRRHGKRLFAALDEGGALALHFGMTGSLRSFESTDDEPRHTRLLLRFERGSHLALVMPRKLGKVGLVDDVDAFLEEQRLGPDALSEAFDDAVFDAALAGRRGSVKAALMNQRLMAGIGNVYSDEILFQAGLHPRTEVPALDADSRRRLFDTLRWVLCTAVDHGADPAELEGSFLLAHRSEGASCPRCDGAIRRIEVSGRGVYYCPACQT